MTVFCDCFLFRLFRDSGSMTILSFSLKLWFLCPITSFFFLKGWCNSNISTSSYLDGLELLFTFFTTWTEAFLAVISPSLISCSVYSLWLTLLLSSIMNDSCD